MNVGDDDAGAASYTVGIYNVTDNSERLRIIHTAEKGSMDTATSTWINVTTGHTHATLVNLPGTVVLSYDVSAPAGLVSSTDINVWVINNGNNSTDSVKDSIDVQTTGNVKAGVVRLEVELPHLVSSSVQMLLHHQIGLPKQQEPIW